MAYWSAGPTQASAVAGRAGPAGAASRSRRTGSLMRCGGGRTRRGRRRRTCAVYAGRLAVHTCSDAVGHTLQLPAGQLDADRFAELAHSTSTTSPLSNSALMPTWRVATSLRSLPSWPRLATSILTGNGAAPQLMRALYHSGWQADAV